MKWCFLASDVPYLMEFFGKLAREFMSQGDSCTVVYVSKLAEYSKLQYFPKEARFISKVDWTLKNYDPQEKEYGGLSWRDFYPSYDRVVAPKLNYEEVLDLVAKEHQFSRFLLEKERPDVLISEPPVGIISEALYQSARKKNIPFLGFLESRINGRLDVYDQEGTDSRYEQTFRSLKEQDIAEKEKKFLLQYIAAFLSHKKIPGVEHYQKVRFSQLSLLGHYLKRIKEVGGPSLRYLRERSRFQKHDYESEAVLARRLRSPFAAEARQVRRILQRFFFSPVEKEDKFYLFPLHLQPESATSVLAMYYSRQLATVRNIAFTLPFPYKLYVKEHPSAVGMQPDSFYEQLKEIPNVKLVSPGENVQELIKASAGVIVLTSTVGMESALAGKPTYVLGNAFYSYHPMCRNVRNFEELREALAKDLNTQPDLKDLDSINLRFLASYFKNTLPASIFAALALQDGNDYAELARELRKRVVR